MSLVSVLGSLREVHCPGHGPKGLTLVVFDQQVYVCGRTQGYRFRVQVSAACGVPREVFLWQRKPILSEELGYKDDFSNVASPADLEEYPTLQPDPDLPPFWRRDFVDLVFRSLDLAEEGLAALLGDLRELVRSLCVQEDLKAIGEIQVGDDCTPVNSSSSVSSSSS
jgi:hypothetical protein